ncbi:hypothetical protein NP233_g621 [Leucocoprinus birnbaumii]|uniref:PARG catalytic Macro domain-containing protein n=1 Tax=Leucocoprinus birnbaumii TaxID=56174 RepID=A0AAD5W3I1_9AGAR|nr:hypothetical protein NP233_g621 [Leucocoprinus birnbaumii]
MSVNDIQESGPYKLPSHPALLSADPLGLCDTEGPTFWDIISVSVRKASSAPNILHLPDLVADLVYSLFGDGSINLDFLKSWLADFESSAGKNHTNSIMSNILASSLSLPKLFPSNEIIHLGPHVPSIELSLAQIRALLAHQILCTTTPPRGNNWGCTLRSWYSYPQPMEHAVRGYLETALRFFEDMDEKQLTKKTIYQYVYSPPNPDDSLASHWRDCSVPLFPTLEIELVTTDEVSFPHSRIHCMLVSSHREPGFGPSCTQEEIITAACPQLLPLGALLVQPPISDHAVLVARDVYPASTWSGQGRAAHPLCFHVMSTSSPYMFLFLDALELDNFERAQTPCLPDLIPENLIRELEKVYTGFSALYKLGVNHIVSPLWGSGAFGGDPIVKSLILSMAAARAGISITLVIDEKRQVSSGSDSVSLVKDVLGRMKASLGSTRVADVWHAFNSVSTRCCDPADLYNLLLELD